MGSDQDNPLKFTGWKLLTVNSSYNGMGQWGRANVYQGKNARVYYNRWAWEGWGEIEIM